MDKDEYVSTDDDFVLTRKIGENGDITFVGGGYKVESFLLEKDISPMTTLNNDIKQSDNKQNGGKVSSPFENLAVPAGLFFINQKMPKQMYNDYDNKNVYKNHETISDDIMDTLFGLANNDNKKRKATRKRNDKINTKKTRRRT
jgi:hypothetical protein